MGRYGEDDPRRDATRRGRQATGLLGTEEGQNEAMRWIVQEGYEHWAGFVRAGH